MGECLNTQKAKEKQEIYEKRKEDMQLTINRCIGGKKEKIVIKKSKNKTETRYDERRIK